MAYQLTVDKIERDGTIRVTHIFYAETKEECEQLRDQHGAGCKAFGPALETGKIAEEFQIIPEIPEWEHGDDNDVIDLGESSGG